MERFKSAYRGLNKSISIACHNARGLCVGGDDNEERRFHTGVWTRNTSAVDILCSIWASNDYRRAGSVLLVAGVIDEFEYVFDADLAEMTVSLPMPFL
jgi:hypothetical protein